MRFENGMTERDLEDLYVLQNWTVTVEMIEDLGQGNWYDGLRESRIYDEE